MLVGGATTILKNMKVNGKDDIQDYPIYEMENKTCSKPPTRNDTDPSRQKNVTPFFTNQKYPPVIKHGNG